MRDINHELIQTSRFSHMFFFFFFLMKFELIVCQLAGFAQDRGSDSGVRTFILGTNLTALGSKPSDMPGIRHCPT